MATYKKFCIHCNGLIPGDSSFCPICSSQDPFDIRCLKCRNPIERQWKICSSCGFKLILNCPKCGKETFSSETCGQCGTLLIARCPSKRCGEIQIITNTGRCIKCGKSLN